MIADGFEKDKSKHQRFYYGDYEIDVVPYGYVAKEDDNIYWPPEETIAMSVKGFDEVLSDAIMVSIDDKFTVKIASLHGLFLLKFNAWMDRHLTTNKDAEDMSFILDNYLMANLNRDAYMIGKILTNMWLVIYGFVLARRVIVAYRRAVRIFDDTHADDIGAYIEWLSIFTYWAVIFGVGCGLLTFLPDKYVSIWILSSIPFYCYLFHCYQNYLLFYEQVENAFEQDIQSEEELLTNSGIEPEMVSEEVPGSYTEFAEKVDNWIKTDGYVQQGLTIKELSKILYTNRTYLSAYIKTTYKMTFREWITSLRLEYAKNILKEHPEINIQKLAESSGFLSHSNFIKLFSEKEGCTPAKWKKSNRE